MIRSILPLVLLLTFPATALLAQSPEDQIEDAKLRALSAGIPVSLLERKVEEAKASGISIDRIASAIDAREGALFRAQATLGQHGTFLTEEDLDAGADALQAGVPEASLQIVGATAPADERATALTVLARLVEQGRSPDAALQRVLAALESGPGAIGGCTRSR